MTETPEERLKIKGRPIDNVFVSEEELFFRFDSSHFREGSRLPTAALKAPRASLNRGKYSEPDDVLFPFWPNSGIGRIFVGQVPNSFLGGDGVKIAVKIEHDPVDAAHISFEKLQSENYAHTEIRAYKNGVIVGAGALVKKRYRLIVSESAKILKNPGVI